MSTGAWSRVGSTWWLAVLLAAVAAQPTLSYLLMGTVNGTWFPAGFWISSAVVVVAVALWLPVPWDVRWGLWPTIFLAALMGAWLVTMASSVLKGNVFLGVVAWLPLAVAMVWSKRPGLPAVVRATDVFAWVLVAGMALFLILEVSGVIGHRTPVKSAEYELRTYWLPLSSLLDLPGRWAGPFAHPNLTSPIAVFLIVYGLWRKGPSRVVFAAFGALVLLLTGTRSALGAVVVGVVLLVAAQRGWLDTRRKLTGWAAGTVLAVGLVIAWAAVSGQSFEGRVPMWGKWLSLSTRSPLFGIGDPGVTLAIEAQELPWWAVHGHNILFDPIVRYGVVAEVFVAAVIVAALAATVIGVLQGRGVGLAILMSVLVCGMFESIIDWRYLNAQAVLLLVSVLLVAARPAPAGAEATRTPPGE